MRSIVYVSLFVAWWFTAIGAFRSSLLFPLLDVAPSQVLFVVGRPLCFLIVGIQASGISIPLFLLMLLGWSLIWIASLTLRVYQWGLRSINLTSFQIGRCPLSDTTLRSHLVRPKDALEPTKQDGVVYKIPCECGKVYIGETGRAMQDRIKEHDRDIRLARTQTSAVSEHTNETDTNDQKAQQPTNHKADLWGSNI